VDYDKGEPVMVHYAARESGLSDVTVDIFDNTGTKIKSGASMTEFESSKVYYYTFNPPKYNRTYVAIMNSASKPAPRTFHFKVGNVRQQQAITTKVIKGGKEDSIWSEEEKDNLISAVKELVERMKNAEACVVETEKRIVDLGKRVTLVDSKVDKNSNAIKKQEDRYSNIMSEVNNVRKTMPTLSKFELKNLSQKLDGLDSKVKEIVEIDRTSRVIADVEDLRVKLDKLASDFDEFKKYYVELLPDKVVEEIVVGDNA